MSANTEAAKLLRKLRDKRQITDSEFQMLSAATLTQRPRSPERRNTNDRSESSHRDKSQARAHSQHGSGGDRSESRVHSQHGSRSGVSRNNTSSQSDLSHNDTASQSDLSRNEGSDGYVLVPGKVSFRYRPSCPRVFNTVELLEHILVHVPRNDLFRASRSCKALQNLINTSLPLRRIMFREPEPGDGCRVAMPFSVCGEPLELSKYTGQHIFSLRNFSLARCDRATSYVKLRDVLLSQPPVHEAMLYVRAFAPKHKRFPSCQHKERVENLSETGITMGDVLDKAGPLYAAAQARGEMSFRRYRWELQVWHEW